ncbi:hypothetical protein ACGFJ7_35520 [Actinoplanes sp. NPDC048988]|uniref:hypothetical protein n=1 Tax=Actinoplanes sp. NPDC048988 TaxID=3363901 RepID=UPI00371DAB3F
MDEPAAVLIAATAQPNVDQALAWLAEGRDLRTASHSWYEVFAALAVLPETVKTTEALRQAVTRSTVSRLDSSADLLAVDRVVTPTQHQGALDALAIHAGGGSLANLSADVVHAAQSQNDYVMICLCDIAGLSYRDLVDRLKLAGAATPPGEPDGAWNTNQIKAAWKVLDAHVTGRLAPAITGATPARAIEHLFGVPGQTATGWDLVANLYKHGVPFSLLLAQRGAGGAWLAHRNRTNNLLVGILTDELGAVLGAEGIEMLTQRDLGRKLWHELLGPAAGPLQVCAIRRDRDHEPEPILGVTIASARDGGTVRKSVGQLEPLPAQFPQLPLAAVVVGPGWADRVLSTTELARAFEGRVYTELQLHALAQLAVQLK